MVLRLEWELRVSEVGSLVLPSLFSVVPHFFLKITGAVEFLLCVCAARGSSDHGAGTTPPLPGGDEAVASKPKHFQVLAGSDVGESEPPPPHQGCPNLPAPASKPLQEDPGCRVYCLVWFILDLLLFNRWVPPRAGASSTRSRQTEKPLCPTAAGGSLSPGPSPQWGTDSQHILPTSQAADPGGGGVEKKFGQSTHPPSCSAQRPNGWPLVQ